MSNKAFASAVTINLLALAIATLATLFGGQAAHASQESAAKVGLGLLGTEFTPAGAIRSGNSDGTIPAWEFEPLTVSKDFVPGKTWYNDPFEKDDVLFTITSANYKQYADKLSPGQLKLFETYPSYFMHIYPSHRSAVYPEYLYRAALENIGRAEIVESNVRPNMIGFKNARIAWPFPLPKNGNEALMNLIVRPQPPWVSAWDEVAVTTSGGSYEINKVSVQQYMPYSDPANTFDSKYDPAAPGSGWNYFKNTFGPTKQAGQVIALRDPRTYTENFRQAWVYNPGQRRVKRAPQIAYDNPIAGSDGLGTTDQGFGGFNGPTDRYEWSLEGRSEMYIPYNAFKLKRGGAPNDVAVNRKVTDFITPDGRLNQELPRYELHRIWKLVGTLRKGYTHVYGKRVIYLDEDTWMGTVIDFYDTRGNLWRVSEAHNIVAMDVGFVVTALETTYDLQSGRMLILNLENGDDTPPDYSWRADPETYFSPANMRKVGIQ